MKIIQQIFGELREHIGKIQLFLMFFCVSVLSLILSLEPLFFGKVISELESYYQTLSFDYKALFLLTSLWLAYTVIFQGVKYFVWQYVITKNLIIDYTKGIKKYADIVFQMTFGAYLGRRIGSIYKIIDRGTDNKLFFFFSFFENYIFNIVSILFIIIILFLLDVKMAAITIALIPFVGFFGYYFVTKTSVKQQELTDRWDEIFGIVGNAMSNFGLFKILSLDSVFSRNVGKNLQGCYDDQMSLNKQWNFSDVYIVLSVMLTRIFVLVAGVYFILEGELTLAELFVIFSYVGWIYFPLGWIFRELRNTVKQLTEVKKLYNDLGTLPNDHLYENGKKLTQVQGNISFQNVGFYYSKEREILKNISFDIRPGQKIAFVGNTGAGKSTLVNLLLRFWDVTSGEILLDGENIKNISKSSLRQHFGVVSQDNSLFNLSIEENLKFAKPKATQKELITALKNAQADFVFSLPQGIKTVIGERGLKLSGGEKQRISLARLFLKNPEILILDEATSALDTKTERDITKALHILMKQKTSIIIAHRISTIMSADLIFVLENGKIVESGNYESLMQEKGKFYNLANPDKLILG